MEVYFIRPLTAQYNDVSQMVLHTLSAANASAIYFNSSGEVSSEISSATDSQIAKADLVLADVSGSNSNVLLELGLAVGLGKRCIIICQQDEVIPLDLLDYQIILYDRKRLTDTLLPNLLSILSQANTRTSVGKDAVLKKKDIVAQKTIFVSYSHNDGEYLARLDIHLKPFERSGQIEMWVDTKIKAGEKWRQKIEHALDRAAIAILLISADFLASDFIIDNELPPLLKAAEEKGTLILPVILKPCRFTRHESLSVFQSINDPKMPLSKMDENDKEEIYVKIADRVDSLL